MPKIQASPALSRFKVLDLSRVRAGPNCVRILTDFGADVIRIEPPPGIDPNEAMFAANHPMGRVGEAIEVVNAIVFLLSDQASFTTGVDFTVDGGGNFRS